VWADTKGVEMVMSKITSCLGCKNEFTEHCKPCDKFSNYDNNPSPQDNAKRSVTLLAKGTGTMEDVEILNDLITNYANMVESLEGLIEELEKESIIAGFEKDFIREKIFDLLIKRLKVLEGKKCLK